MKRFFIILVLLLLVAAAGYGGYWYLRNDPQGAAKPAALAVEEPAIPEAPRLVDDGSDRTTTILNVIDSLDVSVSSNDFQEIETDAQIL